MGQGNPQGGQTPQTRQEGQIVQTVLPEWFCSNCGSAGGQPQPGFTGIDPRYAVGDCDICTTAHPDKPRKNPRPTNQLIRGDVFDPEAFTVKKEKAELAGLVHEYANGKAAVQMSDQRVLRLVELWDRYGFAGFAPSTDTRSKVAAYLESTRRAEAGKRPKVKRGRGA